MRRPSSVLLCTLALLPVSAASAAESPLQVAREEAGEPPLTPSTWPLPGGVLRVTPSDLLGSGRPVRVTFTVRLDRPVPGGALAVELPAAFSRTPASGIRATRAPRAGPGDAIDRDGRSVRVDFGAREREYTFSIDQVGLPAGRYELPLRWRGASVSRETLEPAGAAELTVYAPARESEPDPAAGWRSVGARDVVNASSDNRAQSETFVTADPGNPNRMLVAANGPSEVEAFLDTGAGFQPLALPTFVDAPGAPGVEQAEATCDPVLAADPAGALWFGGLTECGADFPPVRRVALARVDPSNQVSSLGVGLPVRPGSDNQDKPMITFDSTQRRIYATWIELDNVATHVVLAWCAVDLADCLNAESWQGPVAVTPASGSYIYPDVAAGPGGEVHVVWWDYSSTNAVRGATCAAPCSAPGFGGPSTIAILDRTNGIPLPFACPILVAPGGRVGAVPSVEVGPDGRVYVAWGDLRPGSGTTRCEFDANAGGSLPSATDRTWDAYVASRAGALPGSAQPSAAVGTPLIVDGEEGAAPNTDEIFPWLAIDASTGEAWTAFYSTGHDVTRRSAHFHGVSVLAQGDGHLVGPANRMSTGASSHAGKPHGQFGNDFGDYEGVTAADGVVIGAWSDNSTGREEAFAFRGLLQTVGFDVEVADLAELAGADGDGRLEPGERALLNVRVRNTGTRTANGAGGPLVEAVPVLDATEVSVKPARITFPAIAPGASANGSDAIEVAVAPGFDCSRQPGLRLSVHAAEGAETLAVPLSVTCPAGVRPPVRTPSAPPVVFGLVDLEVLGDQRLGTVRRRGLRTEVLCVEVCKVALAVTIDARTARRLRSPVRTLGRATVTIKAGEPQVVRLRLTSAARRALARARVLRVAVRATVGGVSPGGTATLTRPATLIR